MANEKVNDIGASVWSQMSADGIVSPTAGGNKSTPLGYAANLDKQKAQDLLKDPRFIQDVVDYYGAQGQTFATVEDAVDHFYKDRVWSNQNSISMGKDLYDAYTSNTEQAQRLGRLQTVFDALPNFYEEGGRGFSGFAENAKAVILDPVNLVGFGSGSAAAHAAAKGVQIAAREAAEQGVAYAGKSATRAGVEAAAKQGLVSEGLTNAVIEGGFDLGIQNRNVQVGIQDEVSLGRAAISAGAGGVLGGTLGAGFGVGGAVLRNPFKEGATTAIERGIADGNATFDRSLADAEAQRIADEQAAINAPKGKPDPSNPATFEDSALNTAFNDFDRNLEREINDAVDRGLPDGATDEQIAGINALSASGQGTGIVEADNLIKVRGAMQAFRQMPVRISTMKAEADAILATDPIKAGKIRAHAAALEATYSRLKNHVLAGDYDGAAKALNDGDAILRQVDQLPGPDGKAPQLPLDPNAPVRGPGGEGNFTMQRAAQGEGAPPAPGQEAGTAGAVDGAAPAPTSAETTAPAAPAAVDPAAAPTATNTAVTPQTLDAARAELTRLDEESRAFKNRLDNLTRKEKSGNISESDAAELADLRAKRDQINEQKKAQRKVVREAEAQTQTSAAASVADGGEVATTVTHTATPAEDAATVAARTDTVQNEAEAIMADAPDAVDATPVATESIETLAINNSQSQADTIAALREMGFGDAEIADLRNLTRNLKGEALKTERANFLARKMREAIAAQDLMRAIDIVGGDSAPAAYQPLAMRALFDLIDIPADRIATVNAVYTAWLEGQAPGIVAAMMTRLGENAPLDAVMDQISREFGTEMVEIINRVSGDADVRLRIGTKFDKIRLPKVVDLGPEAQAAFQAVKKKMIAEAEARGMSPEFVQMALNMYVARLRDNVKIVDLGNGKKRLVDDQNMNPLHSGDYIGRQQPGLTYSKNGEIIKANAVGGIQSILKPARFGPKDSPFMDRLFKAARGKDEAGNNLVFSVDETSRRAMEEAKIAGGTERMRKSEALTTQNQEQVDAIDTAKKELTRRLTKKESERYAEWQNNPNAASAADDEFFQNVSVNQNGKLVYTMPDDQAVALYKRMVGEKTITGSVTGEAPTGETLRAYNDRKARNDAKLLEWTKAGKKAEDFVPEAGDSAGKAEVKTTAQVIEALNAERKMMTQETDKAIRGREVEADRTDPRRKAERLYARYSELVRKRTEIEKSAGRDSPAYAQINAEVKKVKDAVRQADPTFFEDKAAKRAARKALAESKVANARSENPKTDAQLAHEVSNATGVVIEPKDIEVATVIADTAGRKIANAASMQNEIADAMARFMSHGDKARLANEITDIRKKHSLSEVAPDTKPVGKNEPMVVVTRDGIEVDVKNNFRMSANQDGSFQVNFLGDPVARLRKGAKSGEFVIEPMTGDYAEVQVSYGSLEHALRGLPDLFEEQVKLASRQGKLVTTTAPTGVPHVQKNWKNTETYKGAKEEGLDAPTADDIAAGKADAILDARVSSHDIPEGRSFAVQITSGPLAGTVRVVPAERAKDVSLRSVLGRQAEQTYVIGHVVPGTSKLSAARTFQPIDPDASFIKADAAVVDKSSHAYAKDADVTDGSKQPIPIGEIAERSIDENDLPDYARKSGIKTVADLHNLIVQLEIANWKNPAFKDTASYGKFMEILSGYYATLAKYAPHGIKYPNGTRRSAMNQISAILGSENRENATAIFNVLRGLSGDSGSMPRFANGGNNGEPTFAPWHTSLDTKDRNVITMDGNSNRLQPSFAKATHEIGHWAYFNILSPEERMQFWQAMGKYVKQDGVDIASLRRRLPGSATNELESAAEFFANQFAQWVISSGRAGEKEGLAALWARVSKKVTEVLKKFFLGSEYDLIDRDLIPLFERIMPDEETSGLKYQKVAKKFAPLGGRPGFIAKKLDDYELLKAKIENAIRSGTPEELLAVLAGDGSGSANFVSEVFAVSGKRGSMRLPKKADGTGGGGRVRLFDGGETIGQKALANGDMVDVAADPNGYFVRGKMLRLMYDIQRATADMRKRQLSLDDDAAKAELDRLIASQEADDTFGPEVFGQNRSMEEMALSNFTGDPVDLQLLGNAAVEVLNEAQTALRQQFRRSFPKTDVGDGLAILANGVITSTRDSAVGNIYRKRAQRRKAITSANAEVNVNALINAADTIMENAAVTNNAAFDSASTSSIREMSVNQLVKAMAEMGTQDSRFKGFSAELMRKINSSPEITKAAQAYDPAQFSQLADRSNKSLVNGLIAAFEKADPARVDMIAVELRARQMRLGDKSDPFLLPQDSRVGGALHTETKQHIGVYKDNGIPPSAPVAIREALMKLTHRDKASEYTMRTMAYRMLNLMGRTEKGLVNNNATFMTVEDVYRMAGLTAPEDVRGAFKEMSQLDGEGFNVLRKDLRRYAIGLRSGTGDPFDLMHEIGHMVVRATFDQDQLETIAKQYSEALIKGNREAMQIAAKYGAGDIHRSAQEWFVEGWAKYLGERVAKGDMFAVRNGEQPLRLRGQLSALADRLIEYVAYIVNGLLKKNTVRQQFRRLTFYGDMFSMNKTKVPFKAAVDNTNNYSVMASIAPHYARDVVTSMDATKKAMAREFTMASPNEDLMDFIYYHGTPNGSAMERGSLLDPILEPSAPDALFGPGVYVSKSQALGKHYSEAGHLASIRRMIDDATPLDAKRREGYELAQMIVEKRNQIDEMSREMTLSGYSEQTKRRAQTSMDNESIADLHPDDSALGLLNKQKALQNAIAEEHALWSTLQNATGLKYNPKVMPLFVHAAESFDFRDGVFYSFNGEGNNIMWLGDYLVNHNYMTDSAFKDIVNKAPSQFSGSDLFEMLTESAMVRDGLAVNSAEAKAKLQSAMRELGYDSYHVSEPSPDGLGQHDAMVLFDSSQVKHIDADTYDYERAGIYNSTVGDELMGITHRLADEMESFNRTITSQDYVGIGHEVQRLGIPDALQGVVKKMTRKQELDLEDVKVVHANTVGNVLRENSSVLRRLGAHWFANRIKGQTGSSIYDRHNSDLSARLQPLLSELRALPDSGNAVGRWFKKSLISMPLVGGTLSGAAAGSAVLPGVGTVLGGLGGMIAGGAAGSHVKIRQPASHTRILDAMRQGRQAMARLSPQERMIAERIQTTFRSELERLRSAGIPVGDATMRGYTDTYVPQMWDAEAIRENPNSFLKELRSYIMRDHRMNGDAFDPRDADELATKIFNKILDNDGHLAADSVIHREFSNPFYQRFINLKASDMPAFSPFMVNDLEGILARYYNKTTRKLTLAKEFGAGGHAYNAYRAVAEMGVDAAVNVLRSNKNIFVNRREYFHSADVENLIVPAIKLSEEETRDLVKKVTNMLGDTNASSAQMKHRAKMELLSNYDFGNMDEAMASNLRLRIDAVVNALSDFKKPVPASDLRFMDNMVNVLNQRPIDGTDGTGLIYQASRKLRAFNSVSLLGFTTLSSIPDAVLPLVRSGNFQAWAKGMSQWYRAEPSYRNAARDIGVGIENLIHDRMVNMAGDGSQRFSNSFFNLTLLTPWTNMQREVAALVGFNALKSEIEIARKYANNGAVDSARYKTAVRFLERYGMAGRDLPDGHINFASPSAPRVDDIRTYAQNPQVRYAVMKFTNEAIFTPDPNDVPLWAQTPWGAMVYQLKSYPVMMGRLTNYVMDEAKQGNAKPLIYMLTAGSALGASALAVKDIVQSRGGQDERSPELRARSLDKTVVGKAAVGFGLVDKEDIKDKYEAVAWYVEGLMAMGGLGFVGELFFNSAAQIDNGNYGFNRMMGTILGPSYDVAYGGFKVAGGVQDMIAGADTNGQKREAARVVASRIPVLGGSRDFRESAADLMGQPSKGGKKKAYFDGMSNDPFGGSKDPFGGDPFK